jgi:CheY-like chemotaxis protein
MQTSLESESQTPQTGPVLNVLVVDDEADVFGCFQHALPPPRYVVTFAINGRVASQLAAEHPFDLAFVDYFLAEMNGAEVAQKMRQRQPNLKVFMMSCYPVSEHMEALTISAGASAWISKPLNITEIRGIAGQMLREKEWSQPA